MISNLSRRATVYLRETHYEILKQIRLPAFLIFSLGFSAGFYTLFSVIFRAPAGSTGVSLALRNLGTMGVFSVMTATLFGCGVGLATERGLGWLSLKRASPMPFSAYVVAKLATSAVIAVLILVILTLCGMLVAGLDVRLTMWLQLAARTVVGVLPFSALGLAIGYWVGPTGAPALVNLVAMPMAILSGLWMPFEILPSILRSVGRWLPGYHYSQFVLGAIEPQRVGPALPHLAALAAFALAFVAVAALGHRRDANGGVS